MHRRRGRMPTATFPELTMLRGRCRAFCINLDSRGLAPAARSRTSTCRSSAPVVTFSNCAFISPCIFCSHCLCLLHGIRWSELLSLSCQLSFLLSFVCLTLCIFLLYRRLRYRSLRFRSCLRNFSAILLSYVSLIPVIGSCFDFLQFRLSFSIFFSSLQ